MYFCLTISFTYLRSHIYYISSRYVTYTGMNISAFILKTFPYTFFGAREIHLSKNKNEKC
jgi:hypothetical protein